MSGWQWIPCGTGISPTRTVVLRRMPRSCGWSFSAPSPSLMLSWSYSGQPQPVGQSDLDVGLWARELFKGTTYNVYANRMVDWPVLGEWSERRSANQGQIPRWSDVLVCGPDRSRCHHHHRCETVRRVWQAVAAASPVGGLRCGHIQSAYRSSEFAHPQSFSIEPLIAARRGGAALAAYHVDRCHDAGRDHQRHFGTGVPAMGGGAQRALARRTIAPGKDISIRVGDVRKRPYVFQRPTARDCERRPAGHEPRCQPGRVVRGPVSGDHDLRHRHDRRPGDQS